jgi:hypothetical protein
MTTDTYPFGAVLSAEAMAEKGQRLRPDGAIHFAGMVWRRCDIGWITGECDPGGALIPSPGWMAFQREPGAGSASHGPIAPG